MRIIQLILLQFVICISCKSQIKNHTICDTTKIKHAKVFTPSDSSILYSYYINSDEFPNDSTSINESFYSNGNRKSFYNFINGHIQNGVSINWYKSGSIKSISNFLYGLYFGGYSEWYESGHIKVAGNYWIEINESINEFENKNKQIKINMQATFPRNKNGKNGKWFFYLENGEIIKTEYWQKGILISTN